MFLNLPFLVFLFSSSDISFSAYVIFRSYAKLISQDTLLTESLLIYPLTPLKLTILF